MEVIIKFDQRKKETKALLEYLKSLPQIKVENYEARYNAATEKAIQDAKKGIGVTEVKSVDDLFKKLSAQCILFHLLISSKKTTNFV